MTSTHGSHTSSSHSNSISISCTRGSSGHSSSVGSTFRTSFPGNASDPKNAQMDLLVLTAAANDVRRSLQSPSRGSDLTPPTTWDSAAMSNILATATGTRYSVYDHGTVSVNASADSGHASTSGSNGSGSAPYTISKHLNSGGASYHANTADYFNNTLKTSGTIAPFGGGHPADIDTYNDASRKKVLSELNKLRVIKSGIQSFGTYSASGSNSYHSSHSSCRKEFKREIQPLLKNATELIKEISLVSFKYKENLNEDPNITHYGFLADDTAEEFSTEYHDRMDFTNCIGLLLKAVQELNIRLEKLEKN